MGNKVTPSVESFLVRTGLSKADLLRKLGLDPKSSLIAAYITGMATPAYEMCVRLLQNGMSIEELFGEEIWENAKTQALSYKGSLRDEVKLRLWL